MFTETGTLETVIATISDFILGWAAETAEQQQEEVAEEAVSARL